MNGSVIKDVFQLGKPKIIVLLAITCVAGYLVATRGNTDLINLSTLWWSTFGLCLSAMGANTINMWWDRDIDCVMKRTQTRPLPSRRMQPNTVLALGIAEGILAFVLLWGTVNLWTALMAASGYLFYVLVYTMLLKRRTVQNIVIGGAAGAFPPLVGWAAVQGDVSSPIPWVMFAIIFFWTPPHFWALALMANKDYAKAGIPMLPVIKGVAETKVQIMYYLLILIPITLTLGLFAPFGFLYLSMAAALGAWWLWLVRKLLLAGDMETVDFPLTKKCFMFSVYYLAALFFIMVLDTFV
ncbi:MAG: heme o synthase [Alphaproteobacteria bacterium]|nr:heme o synthase [Alphaproteobacteria bacterium]MDD9919870.1 heme o synthase [Alphaproteobacteria bacterium]